MDQLRAMRVFVRVVAEGGFAAAARSLDMAPAGVTRAVAELEEHLGSRLLHRTTRRIALTESGGDYLDRARRILAEVDEADQIAGASTRQPHGTLRVLAPPAFAVHQLAAHLPRFRERYARLDLEFATPGPVDVADEHFDVSIVSIGQQPLQGDFIARPFARSSFVVCASPRYLERRGRPQEPDDLLQHDALLPAVSAVRRELTLRRIGVDEAGSATVSIPAPRPALSTPHIDMLLAAAVAGLGVAGLPSFVADEALRTGRLERVLPQWVGTTLTLYAAMPTRKHAPARSRAFVDFLVQTFGGAERDPWLEDAAKRPSRHATMKR